MSIEKLDYMQRHAGRRRGSRTRFDRRAARLREMRKPAHLAPRGACWFGNEAIKVYLGVEPDFCPARKAHPAFVVSDLSGLVGRLTAAGARVVEDQPLDGFARRHVDDRSAAASS